VLFAQVFLVTQACGLVLEQTQGILVLFLYCPIRTASAARRCYNEAI